MKSLIVVAFLSFVACANPSVAVLSEEPEVNSETTTLKGAIQRYKRVVEKSFRQSISSIVCSLREIGNDTPVRELLAYLLKEHNEKAWEELGEKGQQSMIDKMQKRTEPFIETQKKIRGYKITVSQELRDSLPHTIMSIQGTGNTTPLRELIAYILGGSQRAWQDLGVQGQNWIIAQMKQAHPSIKDQEYTSLIATMPKSGTAYISNVLYCFNKALLKEAIDLLKAAERTIEQNGHQDLSLEALNLSYLIRPSHWEAPGYREAKEQDAYRDPYSRIWERLVYHSDSYDPGRLLHSQYEGLNPLKNPGARIVYVYRNPLDQLVSWYNHIKRLRADESYTTMIREGERVDIKNFEEFVFSASALKSFLKQYHSYKFMEKHFPKNFCLITYENLISNPYEEFKKMLTFIGRPVLPSEESAFKSALEQTNLNALKELSSKHNTTIINHVYHISNGAIGAWRKHFSDSEISRIEEEFQRFGYSLKDFQIQETSHTSSPIKGN